MKRLVVGILAHVDSGKTTLSEAMLYTAGTIGKLGRVDHGDAFLDTNHIEKEKGITIFSKQAMLGFDNVEITLLDTPGHVDFSAETERALGVLDYAILVINGADGVQSHTETLWKLLHHYSVPTFVFVNKMDLITADKSKVIKDLTEKLDGGCVDFASFDDAFYENVAMTSGELLDEYLDRGSIENDSLAKAIASRRVFPCFFGSALKMEGVSDFLDGINTFTLKKHHGDRFGAKIYKISEDDKGQRLSFMKITGGSLKVKSVLNGSDWSQKINEIRIYSGAKYKQVQEAFAGSICAVVGLSKTFQGEGLGIEPQSTSPVLEPVFTYSVVLPSDADLTKALAIFRKLEEEESQMHVLWNEHLQKIDVQIMGEVQLEILKRILDERFDLKVEFSKGSIIYKETIKGRVEGVGHYEPLRHYSEVHLLLEGGEKGSGLVFESNCSEDVLERNWQRLIMTHLSEKTHIGVLTGSPITDMKITLINGKAHQKHTEGGDFRQSTYRAVRQGLMQAKNILLEPYYKFTLEVPLTSTGRALSDLQRMDAEFNAPETKKDMSVISGKAPISAIGNYHSEVISYTRGLGRLTCIFDGYEPCKNQDEIVESIGYNCEADLSNTPDSVFCAKGSGFTVKWNEVFDYMHIPAMNFDEPRGYVPPIATERKKWVATDDELMKIYENTYGKIQRKVVREANIPKTVHKPYKAKPVPQGPEYIVVDGYNIIFACESLKKISEESLETARELLVERMCNFKAVTGNNIIVVFDAYKVKGNTGSSENVNGITVVYTKEAETADSYIEKITYEIGKNHKVKVATSDRTEQWVVFGNGAIRISATEFLDEVENAEKEMRNIIAQSNKNI